MRIGVWVGLMMGAALAYYGLANTGVAGTMVSAHGLIIVIGGTLSAMLINCPIPTLFSAAARFFSVLVPSRLPSPEGAIEEMIRLARAAQAGGGILSLQDEGRETAGGFVHRAITVAIATGESSGTRSIIEREIKQTRILRMEDANVFRTIGVLSPMFGILGTLLGMIQVLGSLSDPTKVGPSMALALSSAFLGIAVANFLCVPVAGQIRLSAMRETLVLEILLEGVLDITAGKPPYLVELRLASYSAQRRRELEEAETAGAAAPAGGPG